VFAGDLMSLGRCPVCEKNKEENMGREVRMVPADWVHPKNGQGYLIPLLDRFSYNEEEVAEGLKDGWLNKYMPNYGCDVMPTFPPGSCTHFQMYETTTEGTPISPVMETPEALAHWLADNNASAFGSMRATYEQWLATVKSGSAVSMVMENGNIKSGVALEAEIADGAVEEEI
jgi:hypothetical protein